MDAAPRCRKNGGGLRFLMTAQALLPYTRSMGKSTPVSNASGSVWWGSFR